MTVAGLWSLLKPITKSVRGGEELHREVEGAILIVDISRWIMESKLMAEAFMKKSAEKSVRLDHHGTKDPNGNTSFSGNATLSGNTPLSGSTPFSGNTRNTPLSGDNRNTPLSGSAPLVKVKKLRSSCTSKTHLDPPLIDTLKPTKLFSTPVKETFEDRQKLGPKDSFKETTNRQELNADVIEIVDTRSVIELDDSSDDDFFGVQRGGVVTAQTVITPPKTISQRTSFQQFMTPTKVPRRDGPISQTTMPRTNAPTISRMSSKAPSSEDQNFIDEGFILLTIFRRLCRVFQLGVHSVVGVFDSLHVPRQKKRVGFQTPANAGFVGGNRRRYTQDLYDKIEEIFDSFKAMTFVARGEAEQLCAKIQARLLRESSQKTMRIFVDTGDGDAFLYGAKSIIKGMKPFAKPAEIAAGLVILEAEDSTRFDKTGLPNYTSKSSNALDDQTSRPLSILDTHRHIFDSASVLLGKNHVALKSDTFEKHSGNAANNLGTKNSSNGVHIVGTNISSGSSNFASSILHGGEFECAILRTLTQVEFAFLATVCGSDMLLGGVKGSGPKEALKEILHLRYNVTPDECKQKQIEYKSRNRKAATALKKMKKLDESSMQIDEKKNSKKDEKKVMRPESTKTTSPKQKGPGAIRRDIPVRRDPTVRQDIPFRRDIPIFNANIVSGADTLEGPKLPEDLATITDEIMQTTQAKKYYENVYCKNSHSILRNAILEKGKQQVGGNESGKQQYLLHAFDLYTIESSMTDSSFQTDSIEEFDKTPFQNSSTLTGCLKEISTVDVTKLIGSLPQSQEKTLNSLKPVLADFMLRNMKAEGTILKSHGLDERNVMKPEGLGKKFDGIVERDVMSFMTNGVTALQKDGSIVTENGYGSTEQNKSTSQQEVEDDDWFFGDSYSLRSLSQPIEVKKKIELGEAWRVYVKFGKDGYLPVRKSLVCDVMGVSAEDLLQKVRRGKSRAIKTVSKKTSSHITPVSDDYSRSSIAMRDISLLNFTTPTSSKRPNAVGADTAGGPTERMGDTYGGPTKRMRTNEMASETTNEVVPQTSNPHDLVWLGSTKREPLSSDSYQEDLPRKKLFME